MPGSNLLFSTFKPPPEEKNSTVNFGSKVSRVYEQKLSHAV